MVYFNPIAQVGETVGFFVRRPARFAGWIPAKVESISFFSGDDPGVFVELYTISAVNVHGYHYKTTVGRDRLSTCKHLFTKPKV